MCYPFARVAKKTNYCEGPSQDLDNAKDSHVLGLNHGLLPKTSVPHPAPTVSHNPVTGTLLGSNDGDCGDRLELQA